jgi:hypothetical protein
MMRRRRKKLPVDQPPLPSTEVVERHEPLVPPQRGTNLPATIRATVREVAVDMSGEPAPEVLAELLRRLQQRLPGITFQNETLRGYAQAISEGREL